MAALDCERFLEDNAIHDWSISEPKQYQALVEDKIFMGGAEDVESMIQNEGVEIVVDLRGESEQPAFSNPTMDTDCTRRQCPGRSGCTFKTSDR